MKTSIIVTSWNKTQFMAACGGACITSIRAFTDPKDYELIVIETGIRLWDGHGTLGLKDNAVYIQKTMEQDQGNSADMNEGAKHATGELLCFVENDVIFHEDWLPNMVYYFEHNLVDVLLPYQYGMTWDYVQKYKNMPHEKAINAGMEEAGVLMIRKSLFDSVGGWNEKFKKIYMWKAFQQKLNALRMFTTYKVPITHIGGVSYWWHYINDGEGYNKAIKEECL
jgi:GT2 family glycosyltransferase